MEEQHEEQGPLETRGPCHPSLEQALHDIRTAVRYWIPVVRRHAHPMHQARRYVNRVHRDGAMTVLTLSGLFGPLCKTGQSGTAALVFVH
jgi:hypothetical protein